MLRSPRRGIYLFLFFSPGEQSRKGRVISASARGEYKLTTDSLQYKTVGVENGVERGGVTKRIYQAVAEGTETVTSPNSSQVSAALLKAPPPPPALVTIDLFRERRTRLDMTDGGAGGLLPCPWFCGRGERAELNETVGNGTSRRSINRQISQSVNSKCLAQSALSSPNGAASGRNLPIAAFTWSIYYYFFFNLNSPLLRLLAGAWTQLAMESDGRDCAAMSKHATTVKDWLD